MKNILIFPASNEIAFEYFRALRHTKNFKLFGASTDGAGSLVFDNHFFVTARSSDRDLIDRDLSIIVKQENIELLIPTNDDALYETSFLEHLPVPGIRSSIQICRFKSKIYAALDGHVRVPLARKSAPCFVKPDRGQGSKGAMLVESEGELSRLSAEPSLLFLENIVGEEYTIDCFSNRHGKVLYVQPRRRVRVANGITMESHAADPKLFFDTACAIQRVLPMRGAWFFQAKLTSAGEKVVLEVATRISSNSGFSRGCGVNLPLLTIFDAFNEEVQISPSNVVSQYIRSLQGHYHYDLQFQRLYVDLDDTLIVHGKINTDLVAFICHCRNEGKEVLLLTKHAVDPLKTLEPKGLHGLFDQIIWIQDRSQSKWSHIRPYSLIIEDSWQERTEITKNIGKIGEHVYCFGPEVVDCFLK